VVKGNTGRKREGVGSHKTPGRNKKTIAFRVNILVPVGGQPCGAKVAGGLEVGRKSRTRRLNLS